MFLVFVKRKSFWIKKRCQNRADDQKEHNESRVPLQMNISNQIEVTYNDFTASNQLPAETDPESDSAPEALETPEEANLGMNQVPSADHHKNARKLDAFQQFGIYYAMGGALICQGALSICYHVCPSDKTLQFDTTFIYIICMLGHVKIYQVNKKKLQDLKKFIDLLIPMGVE